MANENRNKIKILRRKQVEDLTGLSRSTIYSLMKEDKFPKPIPLGERAVGWVENEVHEWLFKRVDSRDGGREVR